jgi:hypothetical protein
VNRRDILLESTIILDGKERFAPKETLFFSGIQLYRHQTGNPIPGVYIAAKQFPKELIVE